MSPSSATDAEKQPLLLPSSSPQQDDPPSLDQLQANIRHAQREYLRAWSATTSGKWHRRIMYTVTAFLLLCMVFMFALVATDAFLDNEDETWPPRWDGNGTQHAKVPLEAHIMSKCPDAKDCLHDLILPAMQKIGHRVDFRLSFIGNVTSAEPGVSCKHGADECLGNIIELCAQKEYPDPRIFLGFTMCLTRDYQLIPQRELVDNCALEHGIDMDRVERCVTDEDGYLSVDALKESFNRTKLAGVTRSCTVRLNNEIRCIRDDGEWKDCPGGHSVKELIRDVVELTDVL